MSSCAATRPSKRIVSGAVEPSESSAVESSRANRQWWSQAKADVGKRVELAADHVAAVHELGELAASDHVGRARVQRV